ncbi:hypothetical protein Ahy_B03g062430 isoform A [Arachis hypogaea]|uniref:Uncharacterized protein n=1 Tax=Arachis hypogaea TaxID=3818 RepID=A0A444ZU25_ARAHY|nr:hypothetical protein Ahy_B03g062430 isoform A [Arachis hypogaea]
MERIYERACVGEKFYADRLKLWSGNNGRNSVIRGTCGGGEVGIVDRVPTSLQCGAPVGMGDALLDDDDDDDVESDLIANDSSDEIAASNPVGAGGGSGSGT